MCKEEKKLFAYFIWHVIIMERCIMTETLVNYFVELFKGLDKNLIIFIISLLPILELRGGLIAASLLRLPFVSSFVICFVGNILPIPLILLFLDRVFELLKKNKVIKKLIDKLEKRSLDKSEQIKKYQYFGLFLFVAIPLPGTGAWTGSMLASLMGMNRRKSFVAIALGVLGAGIIMSIFSYGILSNIIK